MSNYRFEFDSEYTEFIGPGLGGLCLRHQTETGRVFILEMLERAFAAGRHDKATEIRNVLGAAKQ